MKGSFLGWLLLAAIVVGVGVTFYKTIVLQDFETVYLAEDELEESASEENMEIMDEEQNEIQDRNEPIEEEAI